MLQYILFDLDGTLLPMDQEQFAKAYFGLLGGHVASLVEPKHFITQLLAATAAMVRNNDGSTTNEQVFFGAFWPLLGAEPAKLLPVIEDFYQHAFRGTKAATQPTPLARQAVETALAAGCKVAVATNPIFPRIATEQRLQWAGIADLPLDLVTTYETSCFCKPNPAYYREVAEKLRVAPEHCLMVGNDVEEDLAAADVGMKTYLMTDCLINAKGLAKEADAQGTLAEFIAALPELVQRWQKG